MRPDRFQVRDETIDELNEMVERLFQCVDDINDFGPVLPDAHAVLHDKLIKSACEVREIVHVLKNNLAVFPITPRGFRLEISDVASRAEMLLREYELLD
jgi:hypothetical protein